MIKECNERAYHCPVCSLELSPLENELLNGNACLFHTKKSPKASLVYGMIQGLFDALIYNAKRKKAKEDIDILDLQVCYQGALGKAGVKEYHDIVTLRQKLTLLLAIKNIAPIVEVENET